MRSVRILVVSMVAALLVPGLAVSQAPPAVGADPDASEPRVILDLTAVRAQLAQETHTDLAQIPSTIEVPAAEAAQVCDVPEQTLTSADGANACAAKTTSMRLALAVRQAAQMTDRTAKP